MVEKLKDLVAEKPLPGVEVDNVDTILQTKEDQQAQPETQLFSYEQVNHAELQNIRVLLEELLHFLKTKEKE